MSEATDLYFPEAAIVLGETAAIPLVRVAAGGGLELFLPSWASPARVEELQQRLVESCKVAEVQVYLVHGMPAHRVAGDWNDHRPEGA